MSICATMGQEISAYETPMYAALGRIYMTDIYHDLVKYEPDAIAGSEHACEYA